MNGIVFLEEKLNFCGNFVNFIVYLLISLFVELKDIIGVLDMFYIWILLKWW